MQAWKSFRYQKQLIEKFNISNVIYCKNIEFCRDYYNYFEYNKVRSWFKLNNKYDRVYNNIPKYEKDPLVHFTHTILKLFIENQKEIIHSNKITENRLSFNLITFDKKLERLISYTCYNCYFNNELLSQYEDAFRDVLNKNL